MAVMTLIPNALSSRPMNTPDTDEELFRRFRSAGDEAALDRLFERNWNAAYHIALGILGDPAGAEDVAQEACLDVIAAARKGTEIESFAAWLRRVVGNRAKQQIRSRKRRDRREQRAASPEGTTAELGDPQRALVELTASLPDDQRRPLELHFGLGLTHAEIAGLLDLAKGTISTRIRKGLETLRTRLTARGVAAPAIGIGATLSAGLKEAQAAALPMRPTTEALLAKASKAAGAAGLASSGTLLGGLVVAVAAALLFTILDPLAGIPLMSTPASVRRGGPRVAIARPTPVTPGGQPATPADPPAEAPPEPGPSPEDSEPTASEAPDETTPVEPPRLATPPLSGQEGPRGLPAKDLNRPIPPRAARVTFRIVDERGRPWPAGCLLETFPEQDIADQLAVIKGERPRPLSEEGRLGEDGTVTLDMTVGALYSLQVTSTREGLLAGDYPAFWVLIPKTDKDIGTRGGPGAYWTPPALTEGGRFEVTVTAGTMARIRARVETPAGHDAPILVNWVGGGVKGLAGHSTHARVERGRLDLNVAATPGELTIRSRGLTTFRQALVARPGMDELEIRLEPLARRLQGQVLDDLGAPVAGAVVMGGSQLAKTGLNGAFTLALPAGEVELTIMAEGHARLERTLPAGVDSLEPIRLTRIATLEVRGAPGTSVAIALPASESPPAIAFTTHWSSLKTRHGRRWLVGRIPRSGVITHPGLPVGDAQITSAGIDVAPAGRELRPLPLVAGQTTRVRLD